MSEMTPWIQTLDGKQFWPEKPDPELIDPRTLSIVLARINRFSGHSVVPYSVAQHSINVYNLVKTPELRLPALLHDAHEAYSGFGDVPTPMKRMLLARGVEILGQIEARIDGAVAQRFRFDPAYFYYDEIKQADALMLATEKKFVMGAEPASWADMPEPLLSLDRDDNPRLLFLRILEREFHSERG